MNGVEYNLELIGEATAAKAAVLKYLTLHVQARIDELQQRKDEEPDGTVMLLNHAGPAAAAAAAKYALGRIAEKHGTDPSQLTINHAVVNAKLVNNEIGLQFGSGVREFLIPRLGGADFDMMVDPRHRVDWECGHPQVITPYMYWYMYQRDDTAQRVVDIYPDESAIADPEVYEDDDELITTPFEEDWQKLCLTRQLLQQLLRFDKAAGVGHYAILLIGLNDGKSLDQPADGIDEDGNEVAGEFGPREVTYFRVFGEYHCYVETVNTNDQSPRYCMPTMYNVAFETTGIGPSGVATVSRTSQRVHWTRVVHLAKNTLCDPFLGTPEMKGVFNRLLNLRKIKGGSAEMIWRGGFPGISFEVDPDFADSTDFDRDAFKLEVQKFADGLQKTIDLIGIKANTLNVNIATNPDRYTRIQLEAVAMNKAIPFRIFMGSEEAKLASSEDKVTWNGRIKRYLKYHSEPYVIRPVADRLILLRAIRSPKIPGKYSVGWPDLNSPTDEDKANLALKYAQALSQYVASGMIHLIRPMDFLTLILGLRPADAKKIIDGMGDGLAKLLKVDPSQGSGVNGKSQNISRGASPGIKQGRRKPGTAKKV